MENEECGVRSAECGVRSVENEECGNEEGGKRRVWKMRSVKEKYIKR